MFTTKSSRVIRVATSAVVCVALALGTAGVALAGQGSHSRDHSSFNSRDHGDWNGVSGKVTAFTTTSITLQDRHGTSTTYTTTGTTTYFEDATAGAYADLANGEFVKLDLTSTSPQTVTKVTIFLTHVFGTVTAVAGNVITITGWHSDITTVDVSGTTTYTSGGAASSLAAVLMGVKISAVGLPGTTAGTLNANSVNIWAPKLKTHADGKVTAFTTTSITLMDEGTSTTYTTTGTTTYFEDATAGAYADLANGEFVKLDLTSTSPQTVTKVTISLTHVFGTVTAVAGNVITITGWHSDITTVDVSGTTTYTSGGAASSLAAVLMGVKISAVGLPGTTAGTLNANSVNIWAPKLKTHADGKVTAFTTTSITLMDEGTSTTYTTTGTTTYFEDATAGAYADLANGEFVKLDLTSTSPQTVTKVTISLTHVFGTVTAVAGNVITITGWHSDITTVDVSGTTTYTSGGAASSLAAVLMGVKISAVGLPGTTAGTLNANSVDIWVASGHDHGHNQGFGQGHGGHHHH